MTAPRTAAILDAANDACARLGLSDDDAAMVASVIGMVLTPPRVLGFTRQEEAIVACLAGTRRPQSKEALLTALGSDAAPKIVDVHISRIRSKLRRRYGPDAYGWIQTIWGQGHHWVGPPLDEIAEAPASAPEVPAVGSRPVGTRAAGASSCPRLPAAVAPPALW